jgi:hypothetical protein
LIIRPISGGGDTNGRFHVSAFCFLNSERGFDTNLTPTALLNGCLGGVKRLHNGCPKVADLNTILV